MRDQVSYDDLMRYLDGEVAGEERAQIERAMAGSTELRRDLAVFQAMKDDLQTLKLTEGGHAVSVWEGVNRQLTRPIGWILVLVGSLIWAAYGIYTFITSPIFILQKLATGAIVIGILLLFASVIWEQYRAWLTDPYRYIQR